MSRTRIGRRADSRSGIAVCELEVLETFQLGPQVTIRVIDPLDSTPPGLRLLRHHTRSLATSCCCSGRDQVRLAAHGLEYGFTGLPLTQQAESVGNHQQRDTHIRGNGGPQRGAAREREEYESCLHDQ